MDKIKYLKNDDALPCFQVCLALVTRFSVLPYLGLSLHCLNLALALAVLPRPLPRKNASTTSLDEMLLLQRFESFMTGFVGGNHCSTL